MAKRKQEEQKEKIEKKKRLREEADIIQSDSSSLNGLDPDERFEIMEKKMIAKEQK